MALSERELKVREFEFYQTLGAPTYHYWSIVPLYCVRCPYLRYLNVCDTVPGQVFTFCPRCHKRNCLTFDFASWERSVRLNYEFLRLCRLADEYV